MVRHVPSALSCKMECLSQPMSADPSKHRRELVERLDVLRNNDSFFDVTIAVKSKGFKAHKAILAAASPFFLTLLTSNMKECNEQLIKIELEKAAESVVEDALQYLYTGNVSVTEERVHNLIATANCLLLPSLKTMVDNFLKKTVTTENCLFNYYFADKYECVELKKNCRELINSNFSVVMETEDFLNLDLKQVMEWVSIDDVIVNAEENIFKGIVKWVSHNKNEREEDFPELLHQVCLPFVSCDFLNELIKEELTTKNSAFCSSFVVHAMEVMLREASRQPRKCQEKHSDTIDGIFVCGGKKALCYFPKKDMWYRLADSPFQDYEDHALVEFRSKIYIVDGKTRQLGESCVVEYYTPLSNSWGAFQRNDVVSDFTSCTVLKGDMYATCFSKLDSKSRICRYDNETKCWQDMDAPPYHQNKACVVADEQFLYIIGGTVDGGESAVCTTTRFDPINNKLEEAAGINEGRYNAFGAAMNGKVFIAGGQRSRRFTVRATEAYIPLTNEWQLMADLTIPHFNASMVCFEGMLFVLGGTTYTKSDGITRSLTVEVFDPEINGWKEKSSIPVKSFEMSPEKEKYQACFAPQISPLFPQVRFPTLLARDLFHLLVTLGKFSS